MMNGLSESQWAELRASVKTSQRDRPLSPGKVAELLNKALHSCSLAELAATLQFKDLGTLRKIANLEQLEPDLRAKVTWGARKDGVSMSVAVELQRLDSLSAIREAFEHAQRAGMSRSDARELVRQHLSSESMSRQSDP